LHYIAGVEKDIVVNLQSKGVSICSPLINIFMDMKTIALFALLLISCNSFAQNTIICGKVSSSQKFVVHIYNPINSYHNFAYLDTTPKNSVLVNGKDSIYESIKIDRPEFICIRFENKKKEFINRADILVFPGDSLNLKIDLSIDSSTWITYKGSNKSGQQLFNAINYQPYTKFTSLFTVINKLPYNQSDFVNEVDDCVTKAIKPFETLNIDGKVSNQYLKVMHACFKMLFYQQAIDKLIGDYSQSKRVSKQMKNLIIDKFIASMEKTNVDISGLYNSSFYMNSYYNYLIYKKSNFASARQLFEKDSIYESNGVKYNIDKNLVPMLSISDSQIKQDLWAINILNYIHFAAGSFDYSVIDQYCSIFPDNRWKTLLTKQYNNEIGIANIVYGLQSPIIYIDTTKVINSFNALIKQLPVKEPVFVDCWATWCAPCIGAFAFNSPLDSLLKANKINRLYISIDNSGNKNRWKQSITKYCLGGYHILANPSLIADIKKVIKLSDPAHSPLTIPRYLIVDKNGIVVVNDAISPHDFELLENQIKMVLH